MPGLFTPGAQNGGFHSRSMQHQGLAINAYGGQNPGSETKHTPPGKTAGAALSAGAGTAMAGYTVGSAMAAGGTAGSSAGPWGAVIGAGVGILAYLMS